MTSYHSAGISTIIPDELRVVLILSIFEIIKAAIEKEPGSRVDVESIYLKTGHPRLPKSGIELAILDLEENAILVTAIDARGKHVIAFNKAALPSRPELIRSHEQTAARGQGGGE